MHHLVAAKSDLVWIELLLIIALRVPRNQASRLSFSIWGLRLLASVFDTAFRAAILCRSFL